MFVSFPNPTSQKPTVSLRLGMGEFQPNVYSGGPMLSVVNSASMTNSTTMTASFTCNNCLSWQGGTLNAQSSQQSFIFAAGSGVQDPSNAASDFTMHNVNGGMGTFTLDLTKAIGSDAGTNTTASSSNNTTSSSATDVPAIVPSTSSSSSSPSSSSSSSGGSGGVNTRMLFLGHAVLMPIAVILLAVGTSAMAAKIPHSLRTHGAIQLLAVVLLVIGLPLGVVISGRLQGHFTYAHQILGIVIFGLVILQAFNGTLNHLIYRSRGLTSRPWWNYVHIWTGRVIVLVGVVNVGLGLMLPYTEVATKWAIVWWVLAFVFVLIMMTAGYWSRTLFRRQSASPPSERVPKEQTGTAAIA